MKPLTTRLRSGTTLVELMVVMAIITALAALALMLLPSIANQDMTLKGTAEVQACCKIAQGMAGSARLPRGVRLLVLPGGTECTEIQYIESPPVMIADPQVLVAKSGDPTGANTPNGPRVEILYNPPGAPVPTTPPAPGVIYYRQCTIRGLTADQVSQSGSGSTLVLPTLGAWSKIKSSTPMPSAVPGYFDLDVNLEVFPDAVLGAGTADLIYHFGIYGPPVPIIGEPTVLMPRNIAVDLSMSSPQGIPGQYYDILFAPSGQTLLTPTNPLLSPNTAVFLWVRDTTTVTSMQPTSRSPWLFDPSQRQFQLGGEQQIVGIRNGFIGTAPVLWPDVNGQFTPGSDPYALARQRLN